MLTVVTGPPCSGKSTYVRGRAKPGDIVIDFDVLAQALGSPNPHDHAPHVRNVTIAMRKAAIDAAVTAHRGGATVWIVDCNISAYRARLYCDARAHIVQLDVDRAELHRRASRERPPLWHGLIDKWAPLAGVNGATMGTAVPTVDGSREW